MQRLLKVALALLIAATMVGVAGFIASAQEAGNDATANTLRVSPLRTDLTVDPGETGVVKVTITNPSDQPVSVRVIQNDFVAEDEDGTPAIILDETEYAPSRSLKRFMTPIENLTLGPNEAQVVEVELVVPSNAEAGGYFGAIRFAPTSPDGGGQVNLSPSVASLILLTVSGDAPERLNLTQFEVRRENRARSFFVNTEGVVAAIRFENEGKLQAGPFGKISITKGDEIVHEVDFNDKAQRDMVLPDSARRWFVPIDGIEGFGRYTMSATFTYGTNNQTIEVSETFWVIPMTILVIAGAAILLLIGVVVAIILNVRRRKARGPRSFGSRR